MIKTQKQNNGKEKKSISPNKQAKKEVSKYKYMKENEIADGPSDKDNSKIGRNIFQDMQILSHRGWANRTYDQKITKAIARQCSEDKLIKKMNDCINNKSKVRQGKNQNFEWQKSKSKSPKKQVSNKYNYNDKNKNSIPATIQVQPKKRQKQQKFEYSRQKGGKQHSFFKNRERKVEYQLQSRNIDIMHKEIQTMLKVVGSANKRPTKEYKQDKPVQSKAKVQNQSKQKNIYPIEIKKVQKQQITFEEPISSKTKYKLHDTMFYGQSIENTEFIISKLDLESKRESIRMTEMGDIKRNTGSLKSKIQEIKRDVIYPKSPQIYNIELQIEKDFMKKYQQYKKQAIKEQRHEQYIKSMKQKNYQGYDHIIQKDVQKDRQYQFCHRKGQNNFTKKWDNMHYYDKQRQTDQYDKDLGYCKFQYPPYTERLKLENKQIYELKQNQTPINTFRQFNNEIIVEEQSFILKNQLEQEESSYIDSIDKQIERIKGRIMYSEELTKGMEEKYLDNKIKNAKIQNIELQKAKQLVQLDTNLNIQRNIGNSRMQQSIIISSSKIGPKLICKNININKTYQKQEAQGGLQSYTNKQLENKNLVSKSTDRQSQKIGKIKENNCSYDKLISKFSYVLSRQVEIDQDLKVWREKLKVYTESENQQNNKKIWVKLVDKIYELGFTYTEAQLKQLLTISSSETNPLDQKCYNKSQSQSSLVQNLSEQFIKSEQFWFNEVTGIIKQKQAKNSNFGVHLLDLNKKGFINMEDIVSFVNLYAGKFFRNRDFGLITKRIHRNGKQMNNQSLNNPISTMNKIEYKELQEIIIQQ